MKIGIPKETRDGERRIAIHPNIIKKYLKDGFQVLVESDGAINAGFAEEDFLNVGAQLVSREDAFDCDIVLKLHPPETSEISLMKENALLISFIEPYSQDSCISKLSTARINALSMELVPRTSRAQSMDALSSQANIGGYRAVLEATQHYNKFFPLMMTSAGSAKPAKVCILGVGVAGLQAIATARRLGANVEAYDIRPEVKEQIESLGAKAIELDIGEDGSGEGGYAKELSDEAKKKQQALLGEKLKSFDILVTTANIPGRKAPILVSEETVRGMKAGSVIVDMAAGNGGNCPLSQADKVISHHGVIIVGITNYPTLMAADASSFYARNLYNLLALLVEKHEGEAPSLNYNLEDDIIEASLVTLNGEIRFKQN